MLRLSIDNLRPGLVVANNIYNSNGNLLLARDAVLDDRLIARLANINVDSVYVKNPYSADEPQDVLHETTRRKAVTITRDAFEDFRNSRALNLVNLHDAVKMIIEDIMDNKHVLIQLTDIRTHDDYTFGHSINVCLISTMIGLKFGLSERQLKELALGVILHDIGKVIVPFEILNKKDPLTEEDWRIIKGHAQTGFDILRKQGSVSLLSAHVAYQHHENFDGTGYPRGIAGGKIHQYARIAAIADLYDAITSDRPYRPAMLAHEAYEVVLGSRGTKLDPEIADVFLENVALFPIGTMVKLDTGDIGIIKEIYPKLQSRPVVKLVFDKSGQNIADQDFCLDLTKELTRFIIKVFKPEEVTAMANATTNPFTLND